jgi:AsmA protein
VVLVVVLLTNLEAIVNQNKDALLSRAEKEIGRKVAVDKIGVTLRGGIGIRLENFAVADDPAFSSEPFIEAKSLQVNAKLLPLLRKKFEIKRVILHEPLIRITRDENGNLNTSSFGSASAQRGQSRADTPGGSSASGNAAPLAISLIDINDGELRFVDKVQGLDIRLTRIDSNVEELDLEKPITIELSAAFLDEKPNIELRGTFGPVGRDMVAEQLAIEGSLVIDPIDVTALTGAIPAAASALPPGVAVSGPISAHVDASGTLSGMQLDLRLDASSASVSLPDMFNKPSGVKLTVALKALVKPDKITIDSFDLGVHSLEATGKGEYLMTTPPSVTLSVDSKPTSLADWHDLVPAVRAYNPSGSVALSAVVNGRLEPGTTPAVEGQLSVKDASVTLPQLAKPLSIARSEISFTDKRAEINKSSVVIGESRIDGSATIESFEPLAATYQATSPAVALADVRPPNPKAKKPEVMKGVDVKGRMIVDGVPTNRGKITSSSGSIGDISYQNLEGQYEIIGNKTRLTDVKAKALDGSITGAGVITVQGDTPTFDFQARGTNIDIVAFLDKLPEVSKDMLRGRANMTLDISGTGKEWDNIQTTLSGDGVAEFFDGAIVNLNIFDAVVGQLTNMTGNENLISQSLKDKYPKVFKDRDTEFKNLGSDFVIDNGRLLARNLKLAAREYDITGVGSIGFDKNLSLSVNLLLSSALSTDLTADFKEAKYLANSRGQIEVPFVLEGTLPKLRAKLDQDYFSNVVQKALLDRVKQGNLGGDVKKFFDFGKKKDAPPDTTKKR